MGNSGLSVKMCRFGGFEGNGLNESTPTISGSHCQYLEHLDLSGGNPTVLGKCRHLKTILLFSNTLSGKIPRELGPLKRLQVLGICRKLTGGTSSLDIGNCAELSILVLPNLLETWLNKSDHFQESIPKWITTLPKSSVLLRTKGNFQRAASDEMG